MAKSRIKVTDDLSYEDAEQQLLVLMDESERAEEMRRLYGYLKECDELLSDISAIL